MEMEKIEELGSDLITSSDGTLSPMLKPIFLGRGLDIDLVNKIDSLIDKSVYEIAILPESVQTNCTEAYFFHKLDLVNKNAMLKQREDNKQREEALQQAFYIENSFNAKFKALGIGAEMENKSVVLVFKIHELKTLFENLSNKQIRDMVDKLQIHGFVTPTLTETPYIKQEFAITIDVANRILVFQSCVSALDARINELSALRNTYQNEIGRCSASLLENESEVVVEADKSNENEILLDEKQSIVFNIFKSNPDKEYEAIEISRMYRKEIGGDVKTRSLESKTLKELHTMGLIKISLREDTKKNFYTFNK